MDNPYCDLPPDYARKSYLDFLIQKVENCSRSHHVACYGKEKFQWVWQKVDTLGVYAYGGNKEEPNSWGMGVSIIVPKPEDESVAGWYCYIGPIPNFHS